MKPEEKKKIINKFLWRCFLVLLICFTALYLSEATGYYEYEQHKNMVLTKEKIEEFEQDVKDGKNINLENYIETNDNVPSNKISRIGTYLSDKITIIAKNSIKLIGKIFETIFGE